MIIDMQVALDRVAQRWRNQGKSMRAMQVLRAAHRIRVLSDHREVLRQQRPSEPAPFGYYGFTGD
jgi:hypothetical protein